MDNPIGMFLELLWIDVLSCKTLKIGGYKLIAENITNFFRFSNFGSTENKSSPIRWSFVNTITGNFPWTRSQNVSESWICSLFCSVCPTILN